VGLAQDLPAVGADQEADGVEGEGDEDPRQPDAGQDAADFDSGALVAIK
jgi:hypothetical protein